MQKEIKFHLNHLQAIVIKEPKKPTWLVKAAKALFELLFAVCYYTGLMIFKTLKKILSTAINDLRATRTNFPLRFENIKTKNFVHTFISFLFFCLLSWGLIGSLGLAAKALDLKKSLLKTSFLGDSYLSQAKNDLAKQDFTSAQASFYKAYQTFSQGQDDLAQSGQLLNSLLGLLPQKQAADNLLLAAGLVSDSGQDLTKIASKVSELHLGQAGLGADQESLPAIFTEVNQSLDDAKEKISRADALTQTISQSSIPGQYQEKFLKLRGDLHNASVAINNLDAIFGLLKNLVTGQKTILVLLENNNELRAGGGFIGTYGLLKISDGQVKQIHVSSIYDLDGQLLDVIKPPQPMLNIGPRMFMRDSNWFASFPQSAKKVSDFYEIEGGETPDLVLALTPNLVVDLLKITGPIDLPKYGLTLTADNFVEQTQAQTTISNDLPTNSPKQMLADLLPLLLEKLHSLNKDAWAQTVLDLQDELSAKQIAIYSRDPDLEAQLEQFGWSGSLQSTDRDYLAVISSNLGGTKTDLFIDQKLNLVTNVADDGTVTDQLTITRTNKMPDLPDANNLSYIRIFVPQGSNLNSNLGFDLKNLNFPSDQKYKIDDDIFEWEKNSLTDNLTGTRIGYEAGKTFFGNWLNLKGGQTKTINLTYQLPFKLSRIDRYSLLLQKQLGSLPSDFDWQLKFGDRALAWKNFDTEALGSDNLTFSSQLTKDQFLGLVLNKN